MGEFFRSRASPPFFVGILFVMIGALMGLSVFTFTYAKGTSYLSDDPQACTNCHVMEEEYTAWVQGSHKAVSVCNDCHMPHNFVNKWFTKALNGFNHSLAFTLQDYPANIRIKERNAGIVQDNCIGCHQTTVSQVYGLHNDQSRACTSCHENVGHENRLTN